MPKTNSQLKSENLSVSPRSQNHYQPPSSLENDYSLPSHNYMQKDPYRITNPALPLTDTSAYKYYIDNKDNYYKQTTFMTYSNDVKMEPYSTNLSQTDHTANDHLQYSGYHNQIHLANPAVANEEYKNFQDLNTFMNNGMWGPELSNSPSTLTTTEEENIPSPENGSYFNTLDQYSWRLKSMSRNDLIKLLIQLEREKIQPEGVYRDSERYDNDMSFPTHRQPVKSISSHEAQACREVSRGSLDRQNSPTAIDQNAKVCLWQDCYQNFNSLDSLITHVRNVHVGRGKPCYPCRWEGCRMQIHHPFAKRHKLLSHMRTHTGEKPYRCTSKGCDKSFSRPDSLDIHIKTHSNVRPFKCTYECCTKAYYHARSLKKHEKIHQKPTDEKPPSTITAVAAAPHLPQAVAQAETPPYQEHDTDRIQKHDTTSMLESQNYMSYGGLWQPMFSYLCFNDSRSQQNASYFAQNGLHFRVVPSQFPENLDKKAFGKPSEYASETSKGKANEVYQRLKHESVAADLVIGVDTIVVTENKILEKPGSPQRALEMLRELRGRTHSVFTAVTFVYPRKNDAEQHEVKSFVEETLVEFTNISDEAIQAYVETNEPLDKAGGYGYQGLAAFFIKKIDGDYWNVVGLPSCRLYQELEALCAANEI